MKFFAISLSIFSGLLLFHLISYVGSIKATIVNKTRQQCLCIYIHIKLKQEAMIQLIMKCWYSTHERLN